MPSMQHINKTLRSRSLLLLPQALSKRILKAACKKREPHEIWVYLETTYHHHRTTSCSFIREVIAFFTAFAVLENDQASKGIAEYVGRFEREWGGLYNMAASTESKEAHCGKFRLLMEEDTVKRDFLLAFLVGCHGDVVEGIVRNDGVSYADIVRELYAALDKNRQSGVGPGASCGRK